MNKYRPWELHIWNLHKYLKILKNANTLVVKNLRSLGPSVSHLSFFLYSYGLTWAFLIIPSWSVFFLFFFFFGCVGSSLQHADFSRCSALASLVVARVLSCPLTCRILRDWCRIESVSPCIRRWIPNHWTPRESPIFFLGTLFVVVPSLSHVRLRLPCTSLSPGACSNSCPLSWWCHPTILSSVIPSSCLQSFPTSGSFLISQLFASVLELQLQHQSF